MRSIFARGAWTVVVAAEFIAEHAASANVVINMPPPPRKAVVNIVPAPTPNNTDAQVTVAREPDQMRVGELALSRYSYAREGTRNNYFSGGPYRNYSYGGYPYYRGWGIFGFPFFGFGCVKSCGPCH